MWVLGDVILVVKVCLEFIQWNSLDVFMCLGFESTLSRLKFATPQQLSKDSIPVGLENALLESPFSLVDG